MWEHMGEPLEDESKRRIRLSLPAFEGLLNSIDDLEVERTGQRGELVQWCVRLRGIQDFQLGYVTALPLDDMLYVRFYRMEWDVPRKRIITVDKDGTVWDSASWEGDGEDALGGMRLVQGSDDEWHSERSRSSAVPYLMVEKVDKALADMGATGAQTHFVDADSDEVAPRIGIITALPKEFAAMKALLEKTTELYKTGRGAGRRYLLGEIPTISGGQHSVVLALLVRAIAALQSGPQDFSSIFRQ